MSGETNLNELLKTLSARLVEGVYVFATLPDNSVPANITPRMIFREAEGTTLVLRKTEAEACGLAYEFPCRMITLDVHSSLEAVGFIAHIASELARHDMGVNPVSGFFHDHLFVPDGREQDAMRILERIAGDVP
ncbi:MAG: ACT domain-containing protein [Pseudomonadota bacterium]